MTQIKKIIAKHSLQLLAFSLAIVAFIISTLNSREVIGYVFFWISGIAFVAFGGSMSESVERTIKRLRK